MQLNILYLDLLKQKTMKNKILHILMTNHSSSCESMDNRYCSKKDIIMYIKSNFILVTSNRCTNTYQRECDIVMGYLKSICETHFEQKDRYLTKSNVWNNDLKELRLRNANIRESFDEINYLYCDNAWKEYVIVNKVSYLEKLEIDAELIEERYNNMKSYLQENGYAFLIPELDFLYRANRPLFEYVGENEALKTIDYISKQLNKRQ